MNYNNPTEVSIVRQSGARSLGGDTACAVREQRPIPEQLDALDKNLSDLHQVINSLESQCVPLTSPRPCEPPGKDVKPPTPTQVADRLNMANSAISHAIRRINELREGLHI